MFGSDILEVAIGVVFIYILISIICTAVREGMEAWFKTRAAYLEYAIRELLHDRNAEGLVKNFYNHPLINSLFSHHYEPGKIVKKIPTIANGRNLPSYIPAKNFALTLMDIAARGPDTDVVSSDPNSPAISLENIRMNIQNIRNQSVQRVLLSAIDSAQGDLDQLQKNIQDWYDSAMDRVSGWYKRSSQWIVFWVGLIIAVGVNVNTITIAEYLYHNDAARAAIVARAEVAVNDTSFLNTNYNKTKNDLNSLNLPIGWSKGWGAIKHEPEPGYNNAWNWVFAPIIGWLLTALAATLGAPFWFDVLNKVMVIRSTVKPKEKSPEEASEDRQIVKPAPAVAPVVKLQEAPGAEAKQPKPQATFNQEVVSTPTDAESGVDGCDVDIVNVTPDENLPAAEGGVA